MKASPQVIKADRRPKMTENTLIMNLDMEEY